MVTIIHQGNLFDATSDQCAAVLGGLEKENHWLDLFLEDLSHWCDSAKQASERRIESGTVVPTNAISNLSPKSLLYPTSPTLTTGKIQSTKLTPDEQLNARLQFLTFIVHGKLCTWSAAQSDRVWDCLVAHAIGPEERDVAFDYLQGLDDHDVFTYHYFRARIPDLDVVYFSQQALDYLRHCFVQFNIREGRLKPRANQQHGVVGELIGIDHIWNVALNCSDEYVGSQAVKILAELLIGADMSMPDAATFAKHQWQNMIDLCFGHLVAAASQLAPSTFNTQTPDDNEFLSMDHTVLAISRPAEMLASS